MQEHFNIKKHIKSKNIYRAWREKHMYNDQNLQKSYGKKHTRKWERGKEKKQ